MARVIIALLFLQIYYSAEGFLHTYPKFELGPRDAGDPGDPLYLTPFVKAGNINEARRLARVPLTDSLNITSYSGYFTVNKTYNSNQFFWYFPPINANENAPVIVWLDGGPGVSSLVSLFFQHGPLEVINQTIVKRNYTWASKHHMIYIDNPVGTGFSFTTNSTGYCTDEVQVGEELYATMTQFFQIFPELQSNKFFVTGESYGGKYVPALAYTIHKKNPTSEVKINLKGIAIGNGFSDPEHQLSYGDFLYQLGLVDWNEAKLIKNEETKIINNIKQQKWNESIEVTQSLWLALRDTTGLETIKNYVDPTNGLTYEMMSDFSSIIQETSFRRSVHVGELSYNGIISIDVYTHLELEMMQSVAPWISELLEHYNVLIYNGQLDIIVAYPLTVNYLRHLNFTGAEEYKIAERHMWVVDEEVAGYVKQAGNLTEIMVRNAGHSVAVNQPKWALDMITRFTYEEPYYQ